MARTDSVCRKTLRVAGLVLAVAGLLPSAYGQQDPSGLAAADTAVVSDAVALPSPSRVQAKGLLGERFSLSERNRLLQIDEAELLSGFVQRPGSHPWIGEHVGKWLHAASLTYAATGNPELRAKLDRVAAGLMNTQEADGYLGTYSADKRFGLYQGADWDVWSHKYDLIGLLTYYQYTGDRTAIETCKRVGDLLIATFGPGKKSILSAGTQVGMASTSVLEPMVLLYRATGDRRYLEFAEYIVTAWDEAGGPAIFSSLRAGKPVNEIANGKAYEMLSNLVGLCELYRATGNTEYRDAVLTAWKDVAANRLYITGSGSSHELWQADYHLPNDQGAQICETCVTVTWVQLNMELLRLLGEARFANELEKTVFNHLLAAQKPTGDDWSYYTPLVGVKPYDAITTCCHSSGPRGVALAPAMAYAVTADGIAVNLYGASTATLALTGGKEVALEQRTGFPLDGDVTLTVTATGAAEPFSLHLRVPSWTPRFSVRVNGEAFDDAADASGYVTIRRAWKAGDTVRCSIDMAPRAILGDHENEGRVAFQYGPFVLALDASPNKGSGAKLHNMAPSVENSGPVELRRLEGIDTAVPVFTVGGVMYRDRPEGGTSDQRTDTALFLVPYYAAGGDGSRFCVWMNRASTLVPTPSSLFAEAAESQSRKGNVSGSFADDDRYTFSVTFDGAKPDEDWYALQRPRAATVRRIVFTQGRLFHDGGWFDASEGKPKVQVQKTLDGPWEDAGVLETYPETTATSSAGLKEFQQFEVNFEPVPVLGIRVAGKPSSGDNPAQAFTSCAEISAY